MATVIGLRRRMRTRLSMSLLDQELNAASKKVYESAYELGMAIAQYTVFDFQVARFYT